MIHHFKLEKNKKNYTVVHGIRVTNLTSKASDGSEKIKTAFKPVDQSIPKSESKLKGKTSKIQQKYNNKSRWEALSNQDKDFVLLLTLNKLKGRNGKNKFNLSFFSRPIAKGLGTEPDAKDFTDCLKRLEINKYITCINIGENQTLNLTDKGLDFLKKPKLLANTKSSTALPPPEPSVLPPLVEPVVLHPPIKVKQPFPGFQTFVEIAEQGERDRKNNLTTFPSTIDTTKKLQLNI